MRILALDISTKTGWAWLESRQGDPYKLPTIKNTGRITLPAKVRGWNQLGYPWDFYAATWEMSRLVSQIVTEVNPDLVVIEETNGSKSRYTQKILEWLHFAILYDLKAANRQVTYINTSDWRRAVGATLTKDDKKLNVKVRKLKNAGDKEGLKALGVRGRVGKKHVAIRYVNTTFGMNLKMKDNDIADAICLGTSWFLGVPACDGN